MEETENLENIILDWNSFLSFHGVQDALYYLESKNEYKMDSDYVRDYINALYFIYLGVANKTINTLPDYGGSGDSLLEINVNALGDRFLYDVIKLFKYL